MAEILKELRDKFLLFRYSKLSNEQNIYKNNIENYNKFNNEDLIRVLIIGEKKSGKKFLLNKISNKFNNKNEYYKDYFKFNDIIIKIFNNKKDDLNIEIFNSSIIIYVTYNYSFQIQEKLIQIKKSKFYDNKTKIIIIHNIYIQFIFQFFVNYFEKKIFEENKNYFKKVDNVDYLYNKFFDNEGFFHLIFGDFLTGDEELSNQNKLSIDILYDIIKDNFYYKKYIDNLDSIKKQNIFYPDYFYGIEKNHFFIKVINHDKNKISIETNLDNNSIINFKIKCEKEKNFPVKYKKLFKEKINKNSYEINFSVFYKDFPLIEFNPKQKYLNGMVIFTYPIFEYKTNIKN